MAGGTAVISGVLTFLGVKGDALDRIVRLEPRAVLIFGALIAFGIACGVVVRFVTLSGSVYVWIEATLLGTLIVLFQFVAAAARTRDIERAGYRTVITTVVTGGPAFWVTLAIVGFVEALIFLVAGALKLSTGGAILALGTVIFMLGSYGAVRLAVDSKSFEATPAMVSPAIARKDDGLLHVTTTASAEGLEECERLEVRAGTIPIAIAGPDGTGRAQVAVDSIVTDGMIADGTVELRSVIASQPDSECDKRAAKLAKKPPGWNERAATSYLPILVSTPGPVLTTKWADASTLEVTVSSTHEKGHAVVQVAVANTANTQCTVLSSATFPIGGSGDLSATVPVKLPESVSVVQIGARFTDSGSASSLECADISTMPSITTLYRPAAAAPPASGVASLQAVPVPKRVYDSRSSGSKLEPGEERMISVAQAANGSGEVVPVGATAVVMTLTVTETEAPGGYVSAYASGNSWPGTSSINWFGVDQNIATTVIVGLGGDRQLTLRGGVASTHVVADVTGYIMAG